MMRIEVELDDRGDGADFAQAVRERELPPDVLAQRLLGLGLAVLREWERAVPSHGERGELAFAWAVEQACQFYVYGPEWIMTRPSAGPEEPPFRCDP